MYPATKPWQSTFPQSADHISDVCTENKNSCIADVFQLLCCHLLIVSFRVRDAISLGIDLLLLSTQVPSESEMLLQTVALSKIILNM